jgi:hypothetical protein
MPEPAARRATRSASRGAIRRRGWRWVAALQAALLLLPNGPASAQDIPRTDYLHYLPLEVPRIVAQQAATVELALYGDPTAAGYRDRDPLNGIDDRRDRLLEALARRFAPLMVRNTTLRPMDHARFGDGAGEWPLIIDEWQVATSHPVLVRSDSVNMMGLAGTPCPSHPEGEDCRLRDLIRRFGPAAPAEPSLAHRPVSPHDQRLSVLYFDYPGEDAASWRRLYTEPGSDDLPDPFRGRERVYVHPFVSGPDPIRPEAGYEFVLQYWLFYPTNDGGNDHEGDWEHINVVVSPLSAVAGRLSREAVQVLLAREPDGLDGGDPLVMRRIEYYFHHNVALLDFGTPNAYLPRAAWQADVHTMGPGMVGAGAVFQTIRGRAWADRGETIVNTHPIVYIGADSKGLELLLYAPGGRNRDSHGSYPFPGLFEGVGPAGSSEEIRRVFDHQRYLADPQRPLPEWVVGYDRDDRITIVPDWERVLELVDSLPEARRQWAWLVLPIRWGYPASRSPLAGIVEHAETGNLSPVGPAFNGGWNGTGATPGYSLYAPHRLSRMFRGGFEDGLRNDLGFLNAPVALLTTLPPVDIAYKLLFAPVRAITLRERPAWTRSDSPPVRKLTLTAGLARIETPPAAYATLFNNAQGQQIMVALASIDPSLQVDDGSPFAEAVVVPSVSLEFNLGARVSIENSIRYSHARIGVLARAPDTTASVTGTLQQWEYDGAARYRLMTGAIRPYLKFGYGLTWWRTTDVAVGGSGITIRDGDWVRAPHPQRLSNLLPNAWQFGGGAEWVLLRNPAPFPRGVNAGVRVEYSATTYSLRVAEQVPRGVDVRVLQDRVWRRAATALIRIDF